MYQWSDHRTRIGSLLHQTLDEPIPGGARYAYVKAVLYQLVRRALPDYVVPNILTANVAAKTAMIAGKLNRLRLLRVLCARILSQQLLNQSHA